MVLEQGGGNHDPNFIGSTKAANASGADYAIEVHHNAAGGTGSEVIVNDRASAPNQQLAKAMAAKMASALGIRNRGVIARDREHFNRKTRMPACIPECAFVDSATDQHVIGQAAYATTVAEAICEPLCGFLGVAFQPSQTVSAFAGTIQEEGYPWPKRKRDQAASCSRMRQDMVVRGTNGLENTVEDFRDSDSGRLSTS